VYAAIGRVWLRSAEERGDRAALRKALEALGPIASEPGASSEVLTLYGRALALSGALDAAEQVLQQATGRLPVEPSAFAALAAIAQRTGHLAVGRDALIRQDALSDDDRGRQSRAIQIAEISMRLGDPGAATRWFQRAVDVADADPGLLGRLADAQSRTGLSALARATLDRAIDLDPQDPSLQLLARRIR
jgi:Flp pilus assembly protein TadD